MVVGRRLVQAKQSTRKLVRHLWYDLLRSTFSLTNLWMSCMNVYVVYSESGVFKWLEAYRCIQDKQCLTTKHDQSVTSIYMSVTTTGGENRIYGNALLTFGDGILVPCAMTTEVVLAHSYTYSTWPLIVTWVTSELVSQPGSLPATSVLSNPAVSQPPHNQAIVVFHRLDMNFIWTYKEKGPGSICTHVSKSLGLAVLPY